MTYYVSIYLVSSLLGLGRTLMHRTVEKSSGEGSLMEQDTIENISLPNFFFNWDNENSLNQDSGTLQSCA